MLNKLKILSLSPMERRQGEGGFALVITLLLMVSISTIGLLALMNASTETMISRNEKEQKIAFQVAEAGLNEAYARVHLAANPPNTNYIGYTTVASYPCGSTTCSFNTGWPGSSINAGAAVAVGGLTTGTYTVTVTYATENQTDNFCRPAGVSGACDDGEIVRFGQDFGFPASLTNIANGFLPVYKMTSQGTYKNTTVNLISYLAASSLRTDTEAGLNTNACVNANGTANNLETVKQGSGCACDPQIDGTCLANKTSPDVMDTYLGDTIANIKNIADWRFNLPTGGNLSDTGTDASIWGDWDNDSFSTIIYIDSGSQPANDFKISGNQKGRGILIIDGDLELTGALQYEGLIYVLGTLRISGGGAGTNVTGGVMADQAITTNGGITVDYDQATLDAVARENGASTVVRWWRQ